MGDPRREVGHHLTYMSRKINAVNRLNGYESFSK